MTHGSCRGRAHSQLGFLLVALGAALISLLATPSWDNPARADEPRELGDRVTLERPDNDPVLRRTLLEATSGRGVHARIVGGVPVPDGKYPFMAALSIENQEGFRFCGGSLIDPDSVLTAGHCIRGAESVVVEVGTTVISPSQGQVRAATTAFIHPNFNLSRNHRFNAAVLELDSPVTGIRPISIATARQDNLETPGRKLTVAGWGVRVDVPFGLTNRMREVSVPVVSDAVAQWAYASLSGRLRFFPDEMVAAGAEGKDSCRGDGGGPLFNVGTDRTTQVGIVTYGRGCARAGFPGVYTEVNNPEVRSFIVNAAQQ